MREGRRGGEYRAKGREVSLAAPTLLSAPASPTVTRREIVALLCGAVLAPVVCPLAAHAQQPGKRPTIGFLGRDHSDGLERIRLSFLSSDLRELGWIGRAKYRHRVSLGGRTRDRYASSHRACSAQRQYYRLHVWHWASARCQESNIGDPDRSCGGGGSGPDRVGHQLARPGRNCTGLSNQQTDLAGLRLELLREVVPASGEWPSWAMAEQP